MADTAKQHDWEQIKQALATFLKGYNPRFRTQTKPVQDSQKRLNEANLSHKDIEKAYTEIKKDVNGKQAQETYKNIDKYVSLQNQDQNIEIKSEPKIQTEHKEKPTQITKPFVPPKESGATVEIDIGNYLYDKSIRKYSDSIQEYMFAKSLSPEEKEKHLQHVLKILQKELDTSKKAQSKKANLYRAKKLALQVYKASTSQMLVDNEAKELFAKLSEKAQKSYIKKDRSAQKGQGNYDAFLDDLVSLNKSEKSNKARKFIAEIAAEHIKNLTSQLDNDDKTKYQELLKEKYHYFLPKEDTKKGEKQMTDEVNNENPEATSTQKTFEPKGAWLKAGYMAGIKKDEYADEASFKAAVNNAGYIVEGDNIFIKDGGDQKVEDESKIAENDEKAKERKERKDTVEAAFGDKAELNEEQAKALEEKLQGLKKEEPTAAPLTIDGAEPAENNPPANSDWIQKKIEYYSSISDKLTDYKHDETVTDGFKASFNNAEIHYTSPDNCVVSKDADLTVYETLLKEPDNQGRPVNFGPNLEPQQAKNLMVACLIQGNPIGANAPELSEEDIKAIRESLADKKPEALEAFNKNLEAYQAKLQTNNNQESLENSGAAENTSSTFSKDDTDHIKNALTSQYEIASMMKDGVVKVMSTGNGENSAVAFEAGTMKNDNGENVPTDDATVQKFREMYLKSDEEKNFLAEKFKENPEAFKKVLGDMVRENSEMNEKNEAGKLTDANREKIAALREARKDIVRGQMTDEQKSAHEKKMDDRDRVLAARLGIIPEAYSTAPTKEGEAPKKIEKDKDNGKALADKLGAERVAALTQKFSKTNGDSR